MPVDPTVALVARLELHVPPLNVLLRVVTAPTQKLPTPAISEGVAFTVTMRAFEQPVVKVYVIAVVPAVTPVTIPAAPQWPRPRYC